jgi:hypothetical protein
MSPWISIIANGQVFPSGMTKSKYQYHLKDHIVNTRLELTDNDLSKTTTVRS